MKMDRLTRSNLMHNYSTLSSHIHERTKGKSKIPGNYQHIARVQLQQQQAHYPGKGNTIPEGTKKTPVTWVQCIKVVNVQRNDVPCIICSRVRKKINPRTLQNGLTIPDTPPRSKGLLPSLSTARTAAPVINSCSIRKFSPKLHGMFMWKCGFQH